MSVAQKMHFLLDVFQMAAISLVSEIRGAFNKCPDFFV